MIFNRKKTESDFSAMTAKDLGKYVAETGCIPVPIYSDKNYRDLIVKPRTIWSMNRKIRGKKKPIEL